LAEICYALGVSRHGWFTGFWHRCSRRPVGRLAAIRGEGGRRNRRLGLERRGPPDILPDLSIRPWARGTEEDPRDRSAADGLQSPRRVRFRGHSFPAFPGAISRSFFRNAPLTRAFVSAPRYFIYAAAHASGGAKALRDCIDHLRAGGAVLIFANGDVEPDPAISRAADQAFGGWSRGVGIMLREVPEVRLQAAVISGVLLPRYFRNPLARIRKDEARRQKLAEILQILRQLTSPRAVRLNPYLSFACADQSPRSG